MIKARRIGHVTFDTPDLSRQLDYYTRVMGLAPVVLEPDRAFLATRAGSLAIELRRASTARCTKLAFEVSGDEDLTEASRRLTELDVKNELRTDAAPGTPKSLAFLDPNGTTIELFNKWQPLGLDHAFTGVVPFRLGHVAFNATDPRVLAEFYGRVLGFKVSDWIEDWFVFMRCNSDHHTVNFITGPTARVHHFAFELRDFSHIQNACDLFGERDIKILWGPLRLGPGHNVGVYHRNPDDQIVELYIELDQMRDEELGYFEPRPWHRDHPQRPKVWTIPTIWGLPPLPEFHGRGKPT